MTVQPFALLSPEAFARLQAHSGYSAAALERLVAIDRVVRWLAANQAFGGYAIAGDTAVHGVYLPPPRREVRAMWELCLAPVSSEALPADEMLTAISAALPNASASRDAIDAERSEIRYDGCAGPAVLPVRIEARPLGLGQSLARLAGKPEVAAAGYLIDRRMPFYTQVDVKPTGTDSGLGVPVAYIEEVLLRFFSVLASWPRSRDKVASRVDDRAVIVDDLRLLLNAHYRDMSNAITGPLRAVLERSGAQKRNLIANAILDQVREGAAPSVLPPDLRPAGHVYTSTNAAEFSAAMGELLTALGA